MRNIDAIFRPREAEPVEDNPQSGEKILPVPATVAPLPPQRPAQDDEKAGRDQLGIDPQAVMLFCGADPRNLVPELTRSWARILAAVPHSVLAVGWLEPPGSDAFPRRALQARLTGELDDAGVQADRLVLVGPQPTPLHVRRIAALAEVVLDSYPVSDPACLSAGVRSGLPAIACRGGTARSRSGAAILEAMGLEEWVAWDEAEYVDKAVRLAGDAGLRREVGEQIARNEDGCEALRANYGGALSAVLREAFEEKRRAEAATFDRPMEEIVSRVRSRCERLDATNRFFARLSPDRVIESVVRPYFGSIEADPSALRVVDILQQEETIAQPFVQEGWAAEVFVNNPQYHHRASVKLRDYLSDRMRLHRIIPGQSASEDGEVDRGRGESLADILREHNAQRVDLLRLPLSDAPDILDGYDLQDHPPRLLLLTMPVETPQSGPLPSQEIINHLIEHGYDFISAEYVSDSATASGEPDWKLDKLHTDSALPEQPGRRSLRIAYRSGDRVFLACLDRALEAMD
jgi:hypothetical protein